MLHYLLLYINNKLFYQMKKTLITWTAILFLNFSGVAQELSPYIKVGESNETMQQTSEKVINALKLNSFTILGSYNPSGKNSLKVITFTKNELKNTVIKVKDRGALAAVFKIGLVLKNNKVIISYSNPDYILRAYLRDSYAVYKPVFTQFSSDLKNAMSGLGQEFSPFGGTVDAGKLKDYHYKVMMPYFTEPIVLKEFSTFEEGLKTIEKNLINQGANSVLVYKLIYTNEKVAVFGIGLKNKEKGEAHFLPIIGESNIAAMPYEIILQGKKATMLHGKYRIALHWPQLSMSTFMKIMSTPGDIEETLKELCK